MPTDAELLLQYAREGSEGAFAELVRNHVDLVYSAALRRVRGDAHAAAEVTQDVFVAVARNAERLTRHPVLAAWLHTSTRNAAANLLRRERRYERNTFEAQAMNESLSAESTSWSEIRDVLDDAMDGLRNPEREAIILRFFENQTYPQVGQRLGISAESARMRVDRALEKLQDRLQRRGISSTAAVLGGVLSANSVLAAPAVVAASACSVAAVATTATTSAFGILTLMSTTKIYIFLAGTLATAAVFTLVQQRAVTRQAEARSVGMQAKVARLTRERDRLAVQVEALTRQESARQMRINPPTLGAGEDRVTALREMFARLPAQKIPELKLATEGDWHSAADGKLETEEDYRRAMGKVRAAAEKRFAKQVQPALRKYLEANGNQFPIEPLQLAPFVGPEIDRAMLERWHVVPQSSVKNVKTGGQLIITQTSLIDSDYDHTTVIGPQGFGATNVLPVHRQDLEVIKPVMQAYQAANDGRQGELRDLLPYATTPEQKEAIQRVTRYSEARRDP